MHALGTPCLIVFSCIPARGLHTCMQMQEVLMHPQDCMHLSMGSQRARPEWFPLGSGPSPRARPEDNWGPLCGPGSTQTCMHTCSVPLGPHEREEGMGAHTFASPLSQISRAFTHIMHLGGMHLSMPLGSSLVNPRVETPNRGVIEGVGG